MKLKRRRASEVPPKIRSFIDEVIATPLENIDEPLKGFIWEFDKGDFHHWVDLFNHFDTFFEKHIKTRKDLRVEDDFLQSDCHFPREPILQILRVIRIILENCSNKHFYSSYEHHLSLLLASTDGDVIEACLQTLAAFLKKTVGKYVLRDSSLSLKLFSLAQGWGGKEEGLGLIRCVIEDESDQCAYALASTLHFEFYAANEASGELLAADKPKSGLQIIHLPNIDTYQDSDLEILHKLVKEYRVPTSLRFPLLTRLRFARACSSTVSRQQYTCIRLYAFIVLVQACGDTGDLVSFFNTEPEFINELVSLLSYEDAVPPKIRILSLLSLIALSQDRSRQPSVLAAVTSGGHRGILSSLMQKAIDSVVGNSSKWVAVFLEALLSLIAVLVSSSSGSSAMREAGFIPTLLPLLKDNDPQHLHLVSMAVHVLEAFMDYSNPAAALFRDLGGLDDTISRLSIEVSCVETGSEQQAVSTEPSTSEYFSTKAMTDTSTELDEMHLHYSEAMIAYHRRLLMKALLRAISLGMYAPGSTARIYGSEESLLPQCLGSIFRRAKDFGGGVFALAATVMSDLIHKDPTCFAVLEAAHLPATFLGAISDGVVCSSEAIACIPQCLDALCLNSNGLQSVKDQNALRCFVKIFTSRTYLRALSGDTSATLSSGLDELMRHAPSLRGPGVDMLIEILDSIVKIGSGADAASCSPCVTPVPMETDAEETNMTTADGNDSCKIEKCDQSLESTPDTSLINVESFLPDCICNVARLLEAALQNADTCRIFVEKKGIEAVLQLFSLPLLPLSVSVGQSISVAFKNFSAHHSASLARAVCSFLREHLKSTNEVLVSVGGTQLAQIESSKQMKILKSLSTLDGVLSLSSTLLKGTTTVLSELGSADADVLKDLGRSYREILWQISLCGDVKADDKQNSETEAVSADAAVSNAAGRESDDDANFSMIRYMNPVSVRNGSQSQWGPDRDFLSVVRSGEGFSGRTRNGIRRLRGGRTGRHLEALHIDLEVSTNVVDCSTLDTKKKSPDVLVVETLNKVISTLRAFFTALLKGFSSPNRRRTESGSLNTASKSIGMALAKVFLEAFNFPGYSVPTGLDMSLCVKCRYLGKVVDDMAALTFDSRRRICYTAMINYFYVHGTFKELLTTFEATSQLLWSLPCSTSTPEADEVSGDRSKLSHGSWLLETLQSYCRLLEYFVNSSLLLSPTPASQVQLLVQPVAVGLSIGLFPVPKEPEVFVRMMQSQVMDVILPVWKHPLFPNCSAGFISKIVALVNHIYSGVGDVKPNRSGISGSSNQRLAPPPDEATIATIVEMGFTRTRAEEALRRVESNSVELAMEWLFSHVEDPVQEDDELARALALSLGSSSEPSRVDCSDKSMDLPTNEGDTKAPPLDDILTSAMKLFQGNDSVAFPLMELLVTLCNRNKGEDRPKVISYLIQQLKLFPLEPTPDISALSLVSHILALVLSEDGGSREIAAENGIITVAIELLMNLRTKTDSGSDVVAPKCISSLLLILDSLLQSRPRLSVGVSSGSLLEHGVPSLAPKGIKEKKSNPEVNGKESDTAFEKIFGKSTGYLTIEESHRLLVVACDFIKQHVPAVVMQAALQLCARLTKTHSLSLQFLENGGMAALFSLPRSCIFPGYDTLASTIIRHLLEDPQTLQTAMELEIRQALSGNRHAGRVTPRSFLTSMAPVISRDPVIFMRAAAAVCQLEASGGRTVVVLSKERDKEKEKSKMSSVESGVSINECVKVPESKANDPAGKCSKGHKKIPANLTQVIDQLLDIVLKYPSPKTDENHTSCLAEMEVDQPASRIKGKTKVGETKTIVSDDLSEKSTALAKVTFVLKLLSDVVLMYVHAVGVILRRDSELSQLRGPNYLGSFEHGGILHHILHRLLPLSSDKSAGPDEWRNKLSEKASWFLVVLCGRSNEGRRRVISELVKALSTSSNLESNSLTSNLLPDKNVRGLVELVYSILSKNSTSSTVPGSGCSPDIAKSMVDGGIVKSLTSILQVIDLDHPDSPKLLNLILKSLESLTRVVNASEQISKSGELDKKKPITANGTPDVQVVNTTVAEIEPNQNSGSGQGVAVSADVGHQQNEGTVQSQGNQVAAPNQSLEQDMGAVVEQTVTVNPPSETGMDFIHEEIEDGGGVLHDRDQIDIGFHVENRADVDMGDEDEDMGDDGEDEDDDDEGEDEDEDIAEDGTALMSLADTDVEDHDDTGLGDEYNDDMVDDDDDDFQENHLIEVRWREALDGLDHLQVLGQPGSTGGLFDVAPEPFEGVNVDDFFGLRRSLGYERRRQTTRSSFERSVTEGTRLQHPLLMRPSQSGDFISSGGISSRDSDPSAGNFDLAHFYMFDAPVLPYDHAPASLFGDRLGSAAPPSLSDFSVGLDSLRLADRRGPGDGRWTDDGQPQAGGLAASIAQAIEEQFTCQLRSLAPDTSLTSRQPTNVERHEEQQADALLTNVTQLPAISDDHTVLQEPQRREDGDEPAHCTTSQGVDSATLAEQANTDEANECHQVLEPLSSEALEENTVLNGDDCMEAGERNVTTNEQDVVRDEPSASDGPSSCFAQATSGFNTSHQGDDDNSVNGVPNVDLSNVAGETMQVEQSLPFEVDMDELSSRQNMIGDEDGGQTNQLASNNEASNANGIDPTFLEALPEDLRAEVLASQQAQSAQAPAHPPPSAEDIDPEFLAALPPDIQAEVLAQQRARRIAQQAEGQPVDMDNASIIATFPAELREEVLLTSSEAVLSALPSPLLAEAQMLRDRAMSHYQARSLLGSTHRLNNRRNGLGFDRQTVIDRGVGVTLTRRGTSALADSLKLKEIEGEQLLDGHALQALIRLLRLAQPLGKGLLQRLLLNLCAHSVTRSILVWLLLDMIQPVAESSASGSITTNSQRLYGCQSNVVYGRSQLLDGLPPLVLRRVLEILTYLATNHSAVANNLFYFDMLHIPDYLNRSFSDHRKDKGKKKVGEGQNLSNTSDQIYDIPLIRLLKLLSQPLFLRSSVHLEQVMNLIQVVIHTAASKLETESHLEKVTLDSQSTPQEEATGSVKSESLLSKVEPNEDGPTSSVKSSVPDGKSGLSTGSIFLQLPKSDLHNLCTLLGHEGLSDKVYSFAIEVLNKLAAVATPHKIYFISELSELALTLSSSAVNELITLRNSNMLGLNAGSMAGPAILRVLQTLKSLTSHTVDGNKGIEESDLGEELNIMSRLSLELDPLWQELSECISTTEAELAKNSLSPITSNTIAVDHGPATTSLPPGTQRLLPYIEGFFVLSEKLQANNSVFQQDSGVITTSEVKDPSGTTAASPRCGINSEKRLDSAVSFAKFSEKHRLLLNAFIRQNPGLLEKSLLMMLKTPRLIDFDNKRAYFRSRIRLQHEQHLSGPLRISVRRAYVLEDSYNQLRMRPSQDLKGRLNVHFQGEEGIDAGGLTREWYQLLSRVIFDKGALLFTTVGNNSTFQPNPNSVYQTEHLSYFKFVGRVVAKALFDAQLLDVYFTRSFYKHILGVNVTYHDIEAVDPDYYKNLKWMLENDVSDVPDLTFSMDADEEKHILYEKTQVTDYELKPGGGNIRVTEESKHEYVDLVAKHILTNAIRPQINSFLEGFSELIPRELVSIFNDKELELLISGLPEIDFDDLKANTEYTGYTAASSVVQWFWEVVKAFNKEDMARFLQFVTGTSKVPLEGFKALQGISGPQKFQIHKAYGAPERLPSAHTCFNQLDLPEYTSKDQLKERLLLAIHEASEGFGFG